MITGILGEIYEVLWVPTQPFYCHLKHKFAGVEFYGTQFFWKMLEFRKKIERSKKIWRKFQFQLLPNAFKLIDFEDS